MNERSPKESNLYGLAGEPVTLEDVPSAERHRVRRESIVGRQHDDFGDPEPVAASPDDEFVVGRDQLSPVGPRVLACRGRLDSPKGVTYLDG